MVKGNLSAAASDAKSLQSCPTLCDPIDASPPGSVVPGILQARTLEWVAISFSNAWKWKVKVKALSRVWPSATPWTAAHQAPSTPQLWHLVDQWSLNYYHRNTWAFIQMQILVPSQFCKGAWESRSSKCPGDTDTADHQTKLLNHPFLLELSPFSFIFDYFLVFLC